MKKHSMKHLTAAAAAVALALLAAFPAWAASSTKKITSITLEIEADIEPGTDFGEESIEFDASGDKFYVGDYEVKNDGQAWEEDTVPKLEVTLEANDDYRFSTSIRKDKIRLKGVGAVCKGAARKEAGQQLVLTIELDSLTKSLRPIENVRLNPDGVVSWNPVSTAGSYEFRVYRDGKRHHHHLQQLQLFGEADQERQLLCEGESHQQGGFLDYRGVGRFQYHDRGCQYGLLF